MDIAGGVSLCVFVCGFRIAAIAPAVCCAAVVRSYQEGTLGKYYVER